MGRQKRKTVSPLQKDDGKSRRTGEEEAVSEAEEDSRSQNDWNRDVVADLKKFIQSENARNNKSLAEDIRKHSDERISALEESLSFALTANETLAKRLAEVEARAHQADKDIHLCVRRLSELEQELDQIRQKDLQDWLIFSGPAISSRMSRSHTNEDASRLLPALLQQFMGFNMNMQQVAELRREGRQICVRFSTVGAGSDRYILLRNKTKLRGSGLYIREKLTPSRQNIFNQLLQMKREDMISTVFTRDGAIFVVTDQRDRPRPVRSDAALERLSRELAEVGAGSRPGISADRFSRRPGADPQAARQGRSPMPWDSPTSNPRGEATEMTSRPASTPGRSAEAAERSTGIERSGSAGRSAGSGAGAAGTVMAHRPPASSSSERTGTDGSGGSGAGAGDSSRLLTVPDRDNGDGGDGSNADGGGGGGDGGGGRAAGGGSCGRQTAAESAPAADDVLRPAREQAGVRRRFRGDMRHFVKISSKCD